MRDWVIHDNQLRGWWCLDDQAPPAIHVWQGSRDTIIERNTIADSSQAIGLGRGELPDADARTYDDDPCPAADNPDHIDGIVRNNAIWVGDEQLFAGAPGTAAGVSLERACGTEVVHNSVLSLGPLPSMSLRWPETDAHLANNLLSHDVETLDGAQFMVEGNIGQAGAEYYLDGETGDLHLAPESEAIDAGVGLPAGLADHDLDGEARNGTPDVGADEAP